MSPSLPGRWPLLLIGLAAVAADGAAFRLFHADANSLGLAHFAGFFAALAAALALLAAFDPRLRALSFRQWGMLGVLALLILFLRGGLLGSLTQMVGAGDRAAAVTALFSALAMYAGYRWLADARGMGSKTDAARRDMLCLAAVGYAVVLRLFYLGVPELLFEEAYYWNYAQHPDIGYLDHPLAVAWLIRPFIGLLGDTEFAVRAAAFLCWLVTAGFMYRLTRELFDRSTAYRALLLAAVLPAYFFFGFFMSPDAPVTACWAAAIYFMHQAAIKGKPRAWLGVGIALGLGMSSKYTIALVGAAFVLFVLFDRPARQWLSRPQPYVALLVALVLMSPVVIWNWQHDWISFAFQSQDRLASKFSFSLPRLIGNILIFLTPTGLLSVIALLVYRKQIDFSASAAGMPDARRRSRLFLIWLALFPLAVFAAASLTRASKLNWTGPLWLALIPLLACLISPAAASNLPKLADWSRRAWPATLVICLLLYGASLHWLSLGLPGTGYPKNLHLIGWRDFGREVELLVQQARRETGQDVLVVGMDRNRIASGLAFYRTQYLDAAGGDGGHPPAFETASEHLFGGVGLMYRLWFPIDRQTGKTLLLVADNAASLSSERVLSRVQRAGDIKAIDVHKQGKPAGRYYVRLVTGYRDLAAAGGRPRADGETDD
jgi:4-amino-4-deoxy-L-arabinose transferase and related glycosyltransferases of PMT family